MDQLTAARLGESAGIQPQAEAVQFRLAYMPLYPQQKFVIEVARAVDAVGIANQGVEQRAQLQHLLPVSVVPRQPRDLIAHDDADLAETDGRDQGLKARAGRRLLPGPPLVLVDDDGLALRPAQLQQPFAQGPLVEAALTVLQYLLGI